jgi:predicted metalloprotease with PDZ domain
MNLERYDMKRMMQRMVAMVMLSGAATAVAAPELEIPRPRDVPYVGMVRLEVDATDTDQRVYRVRQMLPVAGAGRLTLFYPRWLPGNHSTTGPIEMLAGLQVNVDGGKRVNWQRDHVLMHAFHVDVPEGATQLNLEFHYVSPIFSDQGRRVMTPDLLGVQWEKVLLYPAGHYARQITFEPSLRLPPGWKFATALDGAQRTGDVVRFAPVALEKLVDSPLFAGPHYRLVELDGNPRAPVRLNVFADRASELEATPEQLAVHRHMVQETLAMFGSRPFAHYDFLLAISDHYSSIGLEHHQSSENAVSPGYFKDWEGTAPRRDLLAHEMVHAWNGKFRRPADLWTPSYEIPVNPSLLWVYEGLTEYWGLVLASRSGLWQPEFTREALALYAATFDAGRAGRQWRDLQDTTYQPIILYRGTQSFPSWQRGRDYYTEGALLWLDVDMKLRELSRDRRSLDDFARSFFQGADGELGPSTYTFDDVILALDAIATHDWAGFLRERLDSHGPGAPIGGLERSGWRLAYGDEPTKFSKASDASSSRENLLFSLGLAVAKDGKVSEVLWDSPAFGAGIAPGMTVVAVNGRAYSGSLLREAVKLAKQDPAMKIDLLLRKSDTFATVSIDYHDGLRYPRLERIEGTPDRLTDLLRARTKAPTVAK